MWDHKGRLPRRGRAFELGQSKSTSGIWKDGGSWEGSISKGPNQWKCIVDLESLSCAKWKVHGKCTWSRGDGIERWE